MSSRPSDGRRLAIRLEQRGAACVARLLDERAPRTCAAVWDALPQGGDAFHGKYARNEIYTLVESFADPEPGLENSTITPIAGDVCAFWFSAEELGSASHGYTSERRPRQGARIVDLALFYERNNLLLNPDVGWVPGTVFATIESGLDEMAAACQDMWLHGVAGERLTFDRAP
jgi:Protein of unknown function (DUF3830)